MGADPSGHRAAGQPVSKAAVVELLCSYVAYEILVRGNSPTTLERSYLGHIDYYFRLQYDDPIIGEARRSLRFTATFEGFRRIFHIVSPMRASKKLAVGLPFIHGMHDPSVLPSPATPAEQLIRQVQILALSIGIVFLLRKSEFLPGNFPAGQSRGLRWDHFIFYDKGGLVIPRAELYRGAAHSLVYELDRSKSDQHGKGRVLSHYRQDSPMCIVTMAEDWSVTTAELVGCSDQYVFELNRTPLFTCAHLVAMLRSAAVAYGISPERISLHCLRYGGATMLATAGFPQYIIELCGGWTAGSQALRTYIQLGADTMSNVSKAMADAFKNGLHDMKVMSHYVGS